MFGRSKKPDPEKRKNRDLSQYGLFDIPNDIGGLNDDAMSDGDSDLESELAAITAGSGGRPKPRPKPKPAMPSVDLDKMVSESMRDVDEDDDDSVDEDDPNLLNELSEIVGDEPIPEEAAAPEEVFVPTTTNVIDLLKSRIEMYTTAIANAKAGGDSGRARRFDRGLKTLKDLLKQASAGKAIKDDDIPPEVSVKPVQRPAESPADGEQPPPPQPVAVSRPAPPIPQPAATTPPEVSSPANNEVVTALLARQMEYKTAALTSKRSGDVESALKYVKIAKQFDIVIAAAKEGQEIDLSGMPPPPSELTAEQLRDSDQPSPAKEDAETQKSCEPIPEPVAAPAAPPPQPAAEIVEATTVAGALEQRLGIFKAQADAATAEGNSSKARRYGRIVKQYQDAIKLHNKGKPIPVDELPTPPGMGPIPIPGAIKPDEPVVSGDGEASASTPAPVVEQEKTPPVRPKPPPRIPESTRDSGNHKGTTMADKQLTLLLERQKEFKQAAIDAKKADELEQAKEYLKIYKGFESVINAARGGLPVDFTTLPIPPSQRTNLEDSFQFVNETECAEDESGDIIVRLQEQLAKQLMMCKNTRDHHRAIGDVASTNRFENLALGIQKDLDFIRAAHRKGLPVPKFHYENKSFNIVKCNTDLSENEVEICIVRGISYTVANPKDVDTYVKVEFPWPLEETFKVKTPLVKDTDSPDYDQRYTLPIERKAQKCKRLFKRGAAKFEVYSKGGFLRSDTLIGTALVKLQPLETMCDIHDSFELMDGRKKVGGKLEVKIRVRNPIVAMQVEHINEKWVIIDS